MRRFADLLGDDGILVLPTVPCAAPKSDSAPEEKGAFRERAIRLLCWSGLSGFPQISLPLGSVGGAPFGISLLGPAGSDMALIRLGQAYSRGGGEKPRRMDTLTRMRAFIDVVEAEGFSAAARKIGRSKALLSKYVRELEDELGALLLNRTTRQFSLTEAGHTYYKRASEIVREVDSLADAVRESSGDVRGRIKLSAPRTFADAPIGQSLIDFAVAHPEIVLEIQLDDRFVDLVEEGFDLAVRITRLENSSLIARRLSPFTIRLCASPEVIEKYGALKRPQDLANKPCVIDTNGRWLVQLAVRRRERPDFHRFGDRPHRGEQPDGGAGRGGIRARLGGAAGLHRRARHQGRPAGADARRPHAEGRRHLRRLSAPALSAGQGARLRRFPGAVVQEGRERM